MQGKEHTGKFRAGIRGAGSVPPPDPSCRDILLKGRNLGGWKFGLQNHVTVEKKLTKKKHVHVRLKTSLYKCQYIYTVICSKGSLSDYGKNNNSSLLSTFSSTAEQELKYQLSIQILNKLLQLWTHKTCTVLCHGNQKCNSQF